ncbi:hypothetical protein [Archangium violaceum]|uniref:Lipoprotein n=1 Tax=Archangium violaceum Cb vi76 TaxID=1406225 RepID=A0A084SJ49_9BACT|nr:hypothetical protein [Archangium violaceum]KFA88484.1 hypothetical protein Q664_41460 [Archangium violaceum Cb vi76]
MKRILPSLRPSLLGLCAVVATGCTIEAPDFSGKSCESVSDCPRPYTCVAARPGAGRTCEVLNGPGTSDPNTGPVPTWCQDIQPILAANCVSVCHGTTTTGSGRADFRLDVYEADGGIAGAQLMAPRIHARTVVFRTMPPPAASPQPTEEQRDLIDRWASGGAPFCETAGTDGGS